MQAERSSAQIGRRQAMIHCRRCAALCRAGRGVTVAASCDSPSEGCRVLGAGGFWRERGSRFCSVAPSVPECRATRGADWSVERGKMALNWPLGRIDVRKSNIGFLFRGCRFSGHAVYRAVDENCFGGDGVEERTSRAGVGRLGEGYCVLMSTRWTAEKILPALAQRAQLRVDPIREQVRAVSCAEEMRSCLLIRGRSNGDGLNAPLID